MEETNIFTELLKIQQEVQPVLKDIKIEGASAKYKAVSHAAVLQETRKRFTDHGVIYFPIAHEVTMDKSVTTANVTYRFLHVPTQTYVDASAIGQGQDKFDKGAGKASTYADKYMVMRMLHIVTGDDPDLVGNDDHQRDIESLRTDHALIKKKLEDLLLDKAIAKDYFDSAMKAINGYWEQRDFSSMIEAKKTLGL